MVVTLGMAPSHVVGEEAVGAARVWGADRNGIKRELRVMARPNVPVRGVKQHELEVA